MSIPNSTEITKTQQPKKKVERPSGVEMMDYGKNIIKDANMRKRNEEGQALMGKLAAAFWKKVQKDPNILFWIPPMPDAYTNPSVAVLPDDRFSQAYLPGNIYRLREFQIPKGSVPNPLNKNLIFERVLFTDEYSYAPRATYSLVDVIRRMLTAQHDTTIYFLDPQAYKEFLTDATRASSRFSNNCEPKRHISLNVDWLKKNVREHPERYTYNRNNLAWIRYRKYALTEQIRNLQDKIHQYKRDLSRTADPGTFGYSDHNEAEQQMALRINKIYNAVMKRAVKRRLAQYPKGAVTEAQIRKAGVTITQEDYGFLPPQVLSEFRWLKEKHHLLNNYNTIVRNLEKKMTSLDNTKKALDKLNTIVVSKDMDPHGMKFINEYWNWYKKNLEEQRKISNSAPESVDEPMSLKNATLLLAGELRATEAFNKEILPVFKTNKESDMDGGVEM